MRPLNPFPALLLVLIGCAGSIAPYDEAAEPERRARLEADLRARLGPAWDQPVPGVAEADLQLGAEVWYKNCDPCHGPYGQGDGPRADRMRPRPSNLHDERRLSAAGEYLVIVEGSPGTGMPAFDSLPERHRLAVARYLAELRTKTPPPKKR